MSPQLDGRDAAFEQRCRVIDDAGVPRTAHLALVPDGIHHRRGPRYWLWTLRAGDRTWEVPASDPMGRDPSDDLRRTMANDGYTLAMAGAHPAADRTGLGNLWLGARNYRPTSPVFPGAFPSVWSDARRRVLELHGAGRLRVAAPQAFHRVLRSSGRETHGRVESMLRGVAIGDALGNSSESMTATDRRSRFGEIRSYLPNRHAEMRGVGVPSDDTQLTFRSLESMLACGRLDTVNLADRFRSRRIFGIGRTMKGFLEALASVADPWDARQHSAGNGSFMRVAGLLAAHSYFDAARDPRDYSEHQTGTDAPWTWDILLGTALTHDDPSSAGSSMGLCAVLEALLRDGTPKQMTRDEVLDLFVSTARIYEGDAALESRVPGSAWRGPCWRIVDGPVREALRGGIDTSAALGSWYSGAFLLETVPTVLFLLARYLDDPVECMIRAVNDTWDNDTIASVCGAVLGARHGDDAFLPEWHDGLLGRIDGPEDGAIERVLADLRDLGGHTDPSTRRPYGF